MLRAQLLDDFEGRNGAAIVRPANRARCGGMPGEGIAEGLEPRCHHRIVRVQDASRAVDDLLAHQRIERDGRQMIRRARWTDRRVVVPGPRFLAERRLRHDPSDAQSRQPVCLRQAVDDDDLVVPAVPERLRGLPVPLGALIHLIGE